MTHHTTLVQRCRATNSLLADEIEAEFRRLEGRPAARSNFRDVGDFHEKFGIPHAGNTAPTALAADVLCFRVGFMIEELAEFCEATGLGDVHDELKKIIAGLRSGRHKPSLAGATDLVGALDALGDLNYVSLGTAHLMGLPFDEAWAEIQRANMSKERATGADDPRSKRGHALDVVKPEGWKAPDHEPAITAAVRDGRSY